MLGNVAIAHVLAHDAGILALGQRVIVAVTRTRLCLLNAQLLQQGGNIVIDVLRTVVRMKPLDLKRKLEHHQQQDRQQECLADALHAGLNLPLTHRIDWYTPLTPTRPDARCRHAHSLRARWAVEPCAPMGLHAARVLVNLTRWC